jgi:hypothetical protein
MNRKPVIDYSLVADRLLFATHGDRCRPGITPSAVPILQLPPAPMEKDAIFASLKS